MASEEERAEVLANAVHDDAESEDNQAGDIPQLSPAERSKTFTFTSSGEFLLLRWLLRGLSLWHPRSSCCFWRYVYPGLISLLLAFTAILALVVFSSGYPIHFNFLSIKLLFVVLFASAYLSHLTGSLYFISRDFEDNVIFITLDTRQLERFRKQMKYYNLRIVMSSAAALASLACSLLLGYPQVLYDHVYDSFYQSQFLTWLVLSISVYVMGMYLAVFWVIDILQLVSNARLRNQHQKFLKWTEGAEAAINDHICNYTTKVETSCRRLRFWFLIHNVSLTIIVPIVVLGNLVGISYLVIAFIAIFILIWAAPLYFAEQIERNDERFCCEANNFYPEQFITAMQNTASRETAVVTLDGGQNEESYQHLTFVSRSEVQLLVAYLKNIRSGFLAVGYTFQLKLSIVAAVFSLSALIFKTNFGKGNMTFV